MKEAQDRLSEIKTKEHEERMRMQYNKKLLNDDFVQSNKAIVDMVQKSKELQDTLKKKDIYNYFPFVAGELIEKHRDELGVQLKQDLKSYLEYSKDKKSTMGKSSSTSLQNRGLLKSNS